MRKVTLTCPFTGVMFNALESADGSLIAHNPITGENMRIGYNAPAKRYLIDKRAFELTETLTTSEAMEELEISRSRISKIVKDNVIPTFEVNGSPMFRKSDIIEYKRTRKAGRPRKEE